MTLHVGDTAPRFTAKLTADGQPVDLTGAAVTVHLLKPDRRTVVTLDATHDGTSGNVTGAEWGDTLDQAGGWRVEVEVTYSDSTVQTFGPSTLSVSPQIA